MTQRRIAIAQDVPSSGDLSGLAGLPLGLSDGELVLGQDVVAEEDLVRRLRELTGVLAEPAASSGERIEYRMLNGTRLRQDEHLVDHRLRYELTAMPGRPLGSEAAKTAGHVHVRPPGATLGFPEVVEVLHGEAGFLIQDLSVDSDGPRSSRAWLVRARPGDWVILPPQLAHVTIDLGDGPLVFSDVIDREAKGVYTDVATSRGFSWYVGVDGTLRPNERYRVTPTLEEVDATAWSGTSPGPLYALFRADPGGFAWLSEPDRFPEVAPGLWERLGHLLRSSH